MSTPAEERRLPGVVVGVIVLWHRDGQALADIPLVLGVQCVLVVLRVAGDEDLPSILGAHQEGAGLVALGEDAQGLAVQHILPADAGVAAVRGVEHLIKAAHQRVRGTGDFMLEDAEHLLVEKLLADAIVIIKSRLCAPADMKGGVDVRLTEVHDLAQLLPVIHLFKVDLLHRRTGDDHAVIAVVLHLVEGLIKRLEVGRRDMGRRMAGRLQQGHVDLNGRIGQQAGDLGLGGDLGRHEVQDEDLQRTDVLGERPFPVHDEDVFLVEGIVGGKSLGDDQRHSVVAPFDGFSGKFLSASGDAFFTGRGRNRQMALTVFLRSDPAPVQYRR